MIKAYFFCRFRPDATRTDLRSADPWLKNGWDSAQSALALENSAGAAWEFLVFRLYHPIERAKKSTRNDAMPELNPDDTFINPQTYMDHYYRVAFIIDSYRDYGITNDDARQEYLNRFITSLSQLYQYEFNLMQALQYKMIDAHADDHESILDFVKSAAMGGDLHHVPLNTVAGRISMMLKAHASNMDKVLNDYIRLKYYSPTAKWPTE